jgi:hypothetical protein
VKEDLRQFLGAYALYGPVKLVYFERYLTFEVDDEAQIRADSGTASLEGRLYKKIDDSSWLYPGNIFMFSILYAATLSRNESFLAIYLAPMNLCTYIEPSTMF